jgi:endonuclease III
MNPAKRREIFLRLQAANPHPTTELEYKTPFELLVAAMLSAQIPSRRALFGVQFYLLPWRLI